MVLWNEKWWGARPLSGLVANALALVGPCQLTWRGRVSSSRSGEGKV